MTITLLLGAATVARAQGAEGTLADRQEWLRALGQLDACLASLPDDLRRVLELHHLAGRPLATVALDDAPALLVERAPLARHSALHGKVDEVTREAVERNAERRVELRGARCRFDPPDPLQVFEREQAASRMPARRGPPGRLVLDRYVIEAAIGSGGMGEVFRAHDKRMRRKVALNVMRLPRDRAHAKRLLDRFDREAEIIAHISQDQANVPFIFDRSVEDDRFVIVMELLKGRDLSHVLTHTGRFALQDALYIAAEVCKPLGIAHRENIIHRDIKPANIFLCGRDRLPGKAPVRLMDFGVARVIEASPTRRGAGARQLPRPGGEPVTEMYCRVKVGDAIDAAVRVTGDRVWLGDGPSKPQPFRVMPLDDAHALGGEDDLENPFGKGLVPIRTEHGELHHLPNLEDPAAPMRRPKDRPLPAGLGPVFLGSPSRRDLAGTYDEHWLETRFPGVAEDASPDLFQMARAAQRLPTGFLRGGERISVWNMHPEHALLECDVPDLVTRSFVRRQGKDALESVAMHLETLHLFPDAEMMVALDRGAVTVEQSDASDIELLAIAAEAPSTPRDQAHYERVVAARAGKDGSGKDRDVIAFLRDDELLPPADEWGATTMPKDELTRAIDLEGAAAKRLRDRRDRMLTEQRAALADAGHDPDAYLPLPPPEPAAPSMDDPVALAETVERMKREAAEKQAEMEAKKAELEEEARTSFAEAGMDWEAEKTKTARAAAGPPKPLADEHMKLVRDAIAHAHELGESLGELEAMASDPQWEPGLRERDAQRLAAYRQTVHLMPAAEKLDGEASAFAKTRMQICIEAGEPLAGLDFTGADLSDFDLSGKDLRGSLLESARLDGAKLDEADLSGAVLSRASLAGTSFRGAKLDDANLGDTDLKGAVFDDAQLRRATLMRSRLDGASFRNADLVGALLLEASFGAVDLEGAQLEKVTFLRVDLRAASFAGASMQQAQFIECDVSDVSFEGASLKSTVWIDTKAIGTRFVDANMTQAALCKGVDATRANFSGATLDRGSLRGAILTGAQFIGARMRFADVSEASAAGARLDHADARGMLAIRIDLRGGSMRSASFMDTLLTGADLRGVDATDVVLFQADLASIITDGDTRLDGAVTTRSNTRPRGETPPPARLPAPAPRVAT